MISTAPPPASGWTGSRDLPAPPAQTFRQWWAAEHDAPPVEHVENQEDA
jgi:L-lactate dehydrogenase complex protein LldF